MRSRVLTISKPGALPRWNPSGGYGFSAFRHSSLDTSPCIDIMPQAGQHGSTCLGRDRYWVISTALPRRKPDVPRHLPGSWSAPRLAGSQKVRASGDIAGACGEDHQPDSPGRPGAGVRDRGGDGRDRVSQRAVGGHRSWHRRAGDLAPAARTVPTAKSVTGRGAGAGGSPRLEYRDPRASAVPSR